MRNKITGLGNIQLLKGFYSDRDNDGLLVQMVDQNTTIGDIRQKLFNRYKG